MQPDVNKGVYPKIKYNNKTLGINFKGLLYDTQEHVTLSSQEAFSAYEYFYENRRDLNLIK